MPCGTRLLCGTSWRRGRSIADEDGERSYVSPDELFFGKLPDLRHVRAFGAPCRVLLLGPDRVNQGKLGLP